MRKLFLVFIIGILGLALAADPAEGYWLSVDEKSGEITAGWEIYQRDGLLYGQILSAAGSPHGKLAEKCKESYADFPVVGKVNKMTVVNTPWIYGLKRNRPGEWSGGRIIDPGSGNMYNCKIIHRPANGSRYKVDTLEMRGEIGLGLGRSQFWQKSNRVRAAGLK